jgi:hypothetical protein
VVIRPMGFQGGLAGRRAGARRATLDLEGLVARPPPPTPAHPRHRLCTPPATERPIYAPLGGRYNWPGQGRAPGVPAAGGMWACPRRAVAHAPCFPPSRRQNGTRQGRTRTGWLGEPGPHGLHGATSCYIRHHCRPFPARGGGGAGGAVAPLATHLHRRPSLARSGRTSFPTTSPVLRPEVDVTPSPSSPRRQAASSSSHDSCTPHSWVGTLARCAAPASSAANRPFTASACAFVTPISRPRPGRPRVEGVGMRLYCICSLFPVTSHAPFNRIRTDPVRRDKFAIKLELSWS